MPKISLKNKERISEQILFYLYSIFPKQIYTSDIAKELARDEEYTKALLTELESKGLIVKISKNSSGLDYIKRARWRLSNKAQEAYSKHQ